MKNKYLYILIIILVLSHVFVIFMDSRKGPRKNSDFYKEIVFLKNTLEFSDEQIVTIIELRNENENLSQKDFLKKIELENDIKCSITTLKKIMDDNY